jgi:hypothetical protein
VSPPTKQETTKMSKLKIKFHSKADKAAFMKKAMPQADEIFENKDFSIVLNVNCQWMLNSPHVYSHEFI